MVTALISGSPAAGRTWSRLVTAEHLDLLASRWTGARREVELQLTLFALGGNRIGKSHKGRLILATVAGALVDLDKARGSGNSAIMNIVLPGI
jgi:hypothetical protein